MKARKSAGKRIARRVRKTAAKAVPPKSRKKYEKNVREQVVALLQKGPATRIELLKKGTFSAASLNIHLKALRKERLLKAQGKRPITFTLVGAPEPQVIDAVFEQAAEPTPAEAPRKKSSAGALVAALAPVDLHDALDAVDRRLGAKHRIPEKLLTLERLAGSLPEPIAAILHEIREDYVRHTV